jgi:hypothetical protein
MLICRASPGAAETALVLDTVRISLWTIEPSAGTSTASTWSESPAEPTPDWLLSAAASVRSIARWG